MDAGDLHRPGDGQHLASACQRRVDNLLELDIGQVATHHHYPCAGHGKENRDVADVSQRSWCRRNMRIDETDRPKLGALHEDRALRSPEAVSRWPDKPRIERVT